MRVLVTIPHYYSPLVSKASGGSRHGSMNQDTGPRIQALSSCINALHRVLGSPQCIIDIAHRVTRTANRKLGCELDVLICTTRDCHLLERLSVPAELYRVFPTQAVPLLLGYECQAVLRDSRGRYDYYCYLEDDLILHDPLLFLKLAWFTRQMGDECLLQPNRYEVGPHQLVRKAYIDGDLPEHLTHKYQDPKRARELISRVLAVKHVFRRASNPHSGCYFLNATQMEHWAKQPYFLDRATSFVGPLESAATLGILRAFTIYKPAPENAAFLEIEHFGYEFMRKIRLP